MKRINLSPRVANVIHEVDILVVGGGPAGIGAAISSSYGGAKVLLLEKNGFLGGNITKSYVETCNYFMKDTPFQSCGVYAKMETQYKERYGRSDDLRPDSPHRFSSEYLKIFLDTFMKDHNVNVLFHSFVNEVVMNGPIIESIIIQTKQGPQAIIAKQIIDCTGDGDVAFAAGAPFEIGRDKDHLTQPGTLSFRIAGVNSAKLLEDGKDKLKEIGLKYKEEYRAGKTGLSCKRQDLPFGRLTAGSQVTYVNYPCAYGFDPTDIQGLSRGEQECRTYIDEMIHYMRGNMEGMERVELASIATEICFRDSRRIKGKYHLSINDMTEGRAFDDVIGVYPQFYDMLSPDAYMDGDGSLAGGGYNGHIYVPIEGDKSFEIPYGSLVPQGIENLLVAGRCISSDHVAQSGIRAISACMLTGEAAGAAAAIALADQVAPASVAIGKLQKTLFEQGVTLPERITSK